MMYNGQKGVSRDFRKHFGGVWQSVIFLKKFNYEIKAERGPQTAEFSFKGEDNNGKEKVCNGP